METALQDDQHLPFSTPIDAIDQTMFLGDAARPPSREITLERLGFAQTPERIAADIPQQFVEPGQQGAVGLDPVLIVCPFVGREQQA